MRVIHELIFVRLVASFLLELLLECDLGFDVEKEHARVLKFF